MYYILLINTYTEIFSQRIQVKLYSRFGGWGWKGFKAFFSNLMLKCWFKSFNFFCKGGWVQTQLTPPFPYTLPLLEYAWPLTNWMYLMYHHVTPQMIKKKTQPIEVYFYLTCALYWNDRIWDITCSSCAVGAHSIAVIQSVFWWFIHVFASVRCSLITRTINLHDLFIKNRLYSSTCISYYGIQ